MGCYGSGPVRDSQGLTGPQGLLDALAVPGVLARPGVLAGLAIVWVLALIVRPLFEGPGVLACLAFWRSHNGTNNGRVELFQDDHGLRYTPPGYEG